MPRRLSIPLSHLLPTVALLALAVWPLARGSHTLYLRDAFNTHLPAKQLQAEAMREGRLPLVDPLRDGGQPQLGNPNTVPLYPDNLLYLVAPAVWAFNAHFWLHLLLAPFAFYWLARAWGLGRPAAWAAGSCYAASGFFLSSLNLYNLVGGLTLAPALVAAALVHGGGGRWRGVGLLALIWALLLLAGDPMTAAAALAAALAALLVARGWRALAAGGLWAALALGTLAAAAQLVEFLRILPASFRGHWGYSPEAAGAASWHPATVLGWVIPFPFGAPDLAFWGKPFFGGDLPLFFALYPGVAALALALAAGRPRAAAGRWAWALVLGGMFLALGWHNPLVRALMSLPGAGLLRLPVKLWLFVALGASVLCGLGFERAFAAGERRPLARALLAVALPLAALWLFLTALPGAAAGLLARLAPAGLDAAFLDGQRLRWAGLCLFGLVMLAVAGLLLRLARQRPLAAGAALLALHVAAQLFLLRPLLARDEVAAYAAPPPLLARLPATARTVHAVPDGLFGAVAVRPAAFPDARLLWYQRHAHQQLFPAAGRRWGRRYELGRSPEGLDSFLGRAAAQTLPGLDDERRLRLLAALGADHLLLARELAAAAGVELLARHSEPAGELFLYGLRRAAPEVYFAGRVEYAPHLNAALSILLEPSFEPGAAAVLPGDGAPRAGRPGRVEVVASGPEALVLAVASPDGGALVVQRAHLPIWRAEIDGRPARPVAANLYRLGLELEPGPHRVRLWVDRRPLVASLAVAAVALAVILALLLAPSRAAGEVSGGDGGG